MKVFRVPVDCMAILFDMDSTLYTNADYVRSQIDLPLERLAARTGKSTARTTLDVAAYRKDWSEKNRGRDISFANAFTAFGVSIEETVKWREELFRPERFLDRDDRLRSALERLSGRFAMAVVTNNPVSVAERTLDVLGVRDMFRAVVGLDTFGVSKPHREPFLKAAAMCGAAPENCVAVGDRYDIDVALPLELGMGGILVDGVADVYGLPETLFRGAADGN